MTTTSDPGKAEVVGWMARHGGSAIEAARHFFPGISPDLQEKKATIFRVWWQRSGQKAAVPQGGQRQGKAQTGQAPPPSPGLDMPDPPEDLAELSDEAYRVWQLDYLRAYLRACKRDPRMGTLLLKQMSEARVELEAVRARAGRTTKLEPTPAAVVLDIAKESREVRLLLEAAQALEQNQPQGEQPATEG